MRDRKKPLYRKVNTRTHGVRHGHGGEYRWSRNSANPGPGQKSDAAMNSKHRHGLDYTPLFRFLLSRVGEDWDGVYSEAVSRLDKPEPVYWLVATNELDRQKVVRVGESSYYSGLMVDDDNRLQIVAPEITAETLPPFCSCCTHTFNGERFTQAFSAEALEEYRKSFL